MKKTQNIYIAFTGQLTEKAKNRIHNSITSKFTSATKVSDVDSGSDLALVEVIYEIQPPLINTNVVHKEFFEKLKSVFDEFEIYEPYFTGFQKGVVK